MAPQAGLEPATDRLTADCSTTELLRNVTLGLTAINVFFYLGKRLLYLASFPKSTPVQRLVYVANCLVQLAPSQGKCVAGVPSESIAGSLYETRKKRRLL